MYGSFSEEMCNICQTRKAYSRSATCLKCGNEDIAQEGINRRDRERLELARDEYRLKSEELVSLKKELREQDAQIELILSKIKVLEEK